MAMDLCIDEKDEERESEAQSVVRAKKRARGEGGRGVCVVNGRFDNKKSRVGKNKL